MYSMTSSQEVYFRFVYALTRALQEHPQISSNPGIMWPKFTALGSPQSLDPPQMRAFSSREGLARRFEAKLDMSSPLIWAVR